MKRLLLISPLLLGLIITSSIYVYKKDQNKKQAIMVEFEKKIKIYSLDCKNKFNLKGNTTDWNSSQQTNWLNCFKGKASKEDIRFLRNEYKKYQEKKFQ